MDSIPRTEPELAAARVLVAGQSEPDGWVSMGSAGVLPSPIELKMAGAQIDREIDPEQLEQVCRWTDRIRQLGSQDLPIKILLATDPRYPLNLAGIDGKPALLFVQGDLLRDDKRAVAIVGSRRAASDARGAAHRLAADLSHLGYTIVSGLARGIDTAAHRGALNAGGRTLAVVGTGIDQVFPPENRELAAEIARRGAIISQFPPGHRPSKTSFPARNAVIAGLSLGSLVIDAEERSGTRSEINHALGQGRPVFLWAPLAGRRDWGQHLAQLRGVHMVDSAAQIEGILNRTQNHQ